MAATDLIFFIIIEHQWIDRRQSSVFFCMHASVRDARIVVHMSEQ